MTRRLVAASITARSTASVTVETSACLPAMRATSSSWGIAPSPSKRSTSQAASSLAITDEGSLRVSRREGLVSVRLAVATVIAHDGRLDDAGTVIRRAIRQRGEHAVAGVQAQ